jgi:tripartite-type tricarboxylate transporter receptor subunit TctC
MLAKSVNVLVVHPSVPAKNVRELIDHAKANPGKLNFSSSGVGASSHLAGELFKQVAGVDIVHVPYRGTGPSTTDLRAGNVQMAIDSAATLLPHIKAGALRALGFATLERQPALPELPTIADTLPGFDGSSINYISVPAGTPQPIIERLNREIAQVLSDRAIATRMTELAIAPIIETPAQLAARIAAEQEKWKRVIERMGK